MPDSLIADSLIKNIWAFEEKARQNGFTYIAGIDEAGRGPLAGPVVSAAVILPESFDVPGIDDSKKLTPKKREDLFDKIYLNASSVGVGIVDAAEIDHRNILRASLLSMSMAVDNLTIPPDFLLIDGIFAIDANLPQETIKKGDSKSISIAAASIVAKVTRDRIMEKFSIEYPLFGFDKHKGYPTKAHKECIKKFGPCPIHRKSFKGVKEYCQ